MILTSDAIVVVLLVLAAFALLVGVCSGATVAWFFRSRYTWKTGIGDGLCGVLGCGAATVAGAVLSRSHREAVSLWTWAFAGAAALPAIMQMIRHRSRN